MADVFSSETGAAGAPSRPLPQAEATVSTENTSPLMRSLKKGGCGCRNDATKMHRENGNLIAVKWTEGEMVAASMRQK